MKILNVFNNCTKTNVPVLCADEIASRPGIHVENMTLKELRDKFRKSKKEALRWLLGFDVIHTHHTRSSVMMSLLFIIRRFLFRKTPRLVHTIHHDFAFYTFKHKLVFLALVYPFRDRLIAVSNRTKASIPLLARKITPTTVIYNGLDLAKLTPVQGRAWNVGRPAQLVTVGRMVSVKDQVTILKAVSLMKAQGLSVQLHMVGDGPLRASLESYAREHDLQNETVFHGLMDRSDAYKKILQCEIAILPSLNEGFGTAIVECMAAGLLVITTNVSVMPEITSGGAVLVPTRSPEAIADIVVRACASPDSFLKIVERGKEVAAGLTIEKSGTSHVSLYSELSAAQ